MTIDKSTKITLGVVLSIAALWLTISYGIDRRIDSKIKPIGKQVDYLIEKTDAIYEIIINLEN